jgi:hypothetical protein
MAFDSRNMNAVLTNLRNGRGNRLSIADTMVPNITHNLTPDRWLNIFKHEIIQAVRNTRHLWGPGYSFRMNLWDYQYIFVVMNDRYVIDLTGHELTVIGPIDSWVISLALFMEYVTMVLGLQGLVFQHP